MFYRGLAEFDLEQFDTAASFLERATRAGPDDQFPFLALSATYGYLGRKHDALSAIARYNAIVVKLGGIPVSIQTWTLTWRGVYLWQKVDDERLTKGLRLAGVPEFLDRREFATHNRLTANEVRSLLLVIDSTGAISGVERNGLRHSPQTVPSHYLEIGAHWI